MNVVVGPSADSVTAAIAMVRAAILQAPCRFSFNAARFHRDLQRAL